MQTRKLAIYFACVAACAGLACQKRVKTSTFVVPFTYSGDLTASAGGIFRWVSERTTGPFFTIHFVTQTPCKEGTDIVGTPKQAAVCHVLPNSDGLYRYQIVPKGTSKEMMKDVTVLNSHVDGCNGCNAIGNNGPGQSGGTSGGTPVGGPQIASSTTAINSQLIVLACAATGSAAVADPVNVPNVKAGEILEWSQDGNASNTWQVTVPSGICNEGTTFGTQQPDGKLACTVASGVKSSTYTYSIVMKNCATPPGTGQLTLP